MADSLRERLMPGWPRRARILVVAVGHLDGRAVRDSTSTFRQSDWSSSSSTLKDSGCPARGCSRPDDRLVHLHAPDHVVGLDREQFLQGVGSAVRPSSPSTPSHRSAGHRTGLTAERLLRDHRVRTGRTRVDLVVDEVVQLDDVHVADRHRVRERLARTSVEQRRFAVTVDHDLTVTVGQDRAEQTVSSSSRAPSNTGVAVLVSGSAWNMSSGSHWTPSPEPRWRRRCSSRPWRPSPGGSPGSGRCSYDAAHRACSG